MKIKRIFIPVSFFLMMYSTVSSAQPVVNQNDDWISHALIFILDGYTYPLYPKIEFDAEKYAEMMTDIHANAVRIITSYTTGAVIPGTEFKVSPCLGNRDLLAECISACKPKGIKVIAYLGTGNTIDTSLIDPEWTQRISPEGIVSCYRDVGVIVNPTCWNTKYRQAYFDFVRHIMKNYDIDGIFFDAWVPFYGFTGRERVCYCDGCRKGFKESCGKDIPYRKDGENYTPEELEIIHEYHKWYKDELYKVFLETKRIIKSYKDIPLICNINNPSGITGGDSRIIEGCNAFMYERGRSIIERAESVSLVNAHGYTAWPYVGTYDPFPRIPHFSFELSQEIYTTVAFGGSPILYHTYFFVDHPESRDLIREAFRVLDKNEDFIKGFKPVEFCAVVWNNNDPPGHQRKDHLWDLNARLNSLGAFTECLHNNIQTTSLLPQDLNNPEILKKYKVLYLADICSLSDKQLSNIDDFVKNGGGLIMTYATSLFYENGEKRSDFALGSIARIKYHEPDARLSEKISQKLAFGSVSDIYLKIRPGQDIVRSPLKDKLMPTHLFETIDALPGAQVIGDLVPGTTNKPFVPGLVISEYGKGKIAYMSAASSAMYQQTGIREYSDLIRNLVDYLSNNTSPYEVSCPYASLITNMMKKGNTQIIHLINWTGSKSEKMWQNAYFISSIENVTIKYPIPEGKKIKNVSLFIPSKYTIKYQKNDLMIRIPRIEQYQGIIIELE